MARAEASASCKTAAVRIKQLWRGWRIAPCACRALNTKIPRIRHKGATPVAVGLWHSRNFLMNAPKWTRESQYETGSVRRSEPSPPQNRISGRNIGRKAEGGRRSYRLQSTLDNSWQRHT